MPSQLSIANAYESVGKSGTANPGDNLSLGDITLGCPPTVSIYDVQSAYNVVGNAWGYNPTGDNQVSLGTISDHSALGGFQNNIGMKFKFTPTAALAADCLGADGNFANTFPYNIGQLGIKMNNTNVSSGGLSGTYSYPVNGYTTWTSVASGTVYKIPSASGTSATIAFWFKPTIQASARNFFWADHDAIGDVNPYRGWWMQLNTDGKIGFNRGDGTGAASSDRYSFASSGVFTSGQWQFAAIIINQSSNTIGTGTNYAYCYVYDSRTSTWGWTNGASFVSGTGGGMAWSGDSGTETTNMMSFNPLGSTSNGLVMEVGHVYIFQGSLSQGYVETIRELTDGYTS